MNKWDEPVIYPWAKWIKFLWKTFDEVLEYMVTKTNIFMFGTTLVLGITIVIPITFLFGVFQTIEYPMGVVVNLVDRKIGKMSNILIPFVLIPIIVLTSIIAFTWGLPMIIYLAIEKRQEKKLAKVEFESYIQTTQQEHNRVRVKQKDFIPTKQIKQHKLL
jgi:hypothetical protein